MFVILGEALIDMIVQDSSTTKTYFGGGPLNTAIALARLDEQVYFNFPISNDYYGTQTLDFLKTNNVEYIYPEISDLPTTLAMSSLDAEGKSTYQFYRHHTAQRDLNPTLLTKAIPENAKCVHTGTLAIAQEPDVSIIKEALVRAKQQGAIISVDPNVRANNFKNLEEYRNNVFAIMSLADIIKLSDDDLYFLYPDVSFSTAKQSLEQQFSSCPLIVITKGSDATVARSFNDDLEYQPKSLGDSLGDTIGAGDCFIAGLLHGLIQQSLLSTEALKNITAQQLTEVLAMANTIAGLNCQQQGCNPPYKHQLAT